MDPLILLLLQTLLSPEVRSPLARVTEEISPGGAAEVFLIGDAAPGQPVNVRLSGSQGRPTVAVTLARLGSAGRRQIWAGFVPTGPDWPPGDYSLEWLGLDAPPLARRVRLNPRDFPNETIRLDRRNTQIRAAPNPRRDREVRDLNDLLFRVNPEAPLTLGQVGWPLAVAWRRTSGYGERRTFVYDTGERSETRHWGLDFAAPTGTPVLAPSAGRVVMARDRVSTGWTVVLEQGPGLYGLFYHLDSLTVTEGQWVELHQPLGTLGATGLATGPHLHWEQRFAGVAVDPEALLGRRAWSAWPGP